MATSRALQGSPSRERTRRRLPSLRLKAPVPEVKKEKKAAKPAPKKEEVLTPKKVRWRATV
eukprot:scaffold347_cov239-Pinguiococcus_pyrenoidosus.AAC.13